MWGVTLSSGGMVLGVRMSAIFSMNCIKTQCVTLRYIDRERERERERRERFHLVMNLTLLVMLS